jgi:hypothetical protein
MLLVPITDPLAGSEFEIRTFLMKQSPVGSSVRKVKALICAEGWRETSRWTNSNIATSDCGHLDEKGGTLLSARLVHFQSILWHLDTNACWNFDSSGRLADLRVQKIFGVF